MEYRLGGIEDAEQRALDPQLGNPLEFDHRGPWVLHRQDCDADQALRSAGAKLSQPGIEACRQAPFRSGSWNCIGIGGP